MHSDWLEHSPIDDAHEINSLIQKNKIDILIVDHYALDKTWEEIIYPKIKKLVVMDDLNDREHYCHILANLNFGAENIFPIKVNIDAKKLLGTKYLLINPDFLNFKTKRVRKKLKKVLLFFGGVDNEEYTEKFIEKNYFNKFPELQFNLLSRKPGHKKWENHFKNLTAHINSNNIPELMFNSDLYIGSGGTITTERLYMGLPGLIVCVAKNQEVTNQSLFTENLGKKINFPNDSESIIEILRDLIKQPDWLASTSKKCYDIYSPYSLENFIFEILN
jgi:UDP-2,4-diacetamido-2,4,6-trideoxy-beta-L-altropyranose hydrolase